MKQCFGYVRVSSIKQGEGVSLDAQKDAILRFAEQNGIKIIRWFEEQQTAAKSGRPVFNGMIKALNANKADGVVMHKIDRSARNFFDWAKIGELADRGIAVHFATESLDFQSRGGRLTANIQMAVAEDYVRNLRAEVFKGQRGQLERGYYPFGAPLGYLNNGKRQLKTIDPIKGPLVKQAFELYGSGQHSIRSLRLQMATIGLNRGHGRPLPKGSVERLLANPFYAGVISIKTTGETFQGAHEPLISMELFQKVQDIKAGKYGKKITRHDHQFRGLFTCGHCSRSMIPERQKGHVYYRCQFPKCPRNCVREELLADAIIETLEIQKAPPALLKRIANRVAAWARENNEPTIDRQKACTLQIAKVDQQMERLEDAAIDQIIDKVSFNRRKEKLILEKAALEQEKQKITKKLQNPNTFPGFLELIKSLKTHYEMADLPTKRQIVQMTVSNRTVSSKNVFVEPSNWLKDTQDALGVLLCASGRTRTHNTTAET